MTHIICIPYSWRAEILEKVFLMMVRFFVCVMTQDVARWHSSSKKTKMLIFVRISVMIRQHLAFGHVGPSCWHFLPTYVLPVLQSPSSVPPSSWAYPHPRPKGDSHFSLLHSVRSPWNYFHHCTLIENNLHNFPSKNMNWTFCLCIISDERGTEINMAWFVPVVPDPVLGKHQPAFCDFSCTGFSALFTSFCVNKESPHRGCCPNFPFIPIFGGYSTCLQYELGLRFLIYKIRK